MKFRMDYLRLLTHKYSEMWTFYTETLGLKPRFNDKNGVYEEFDTQDATLSLYDKKMMMRELKNKIHDTEGSTNDNHVIIFKVDNVNDVYNKLIEKGVEFIAPPTDRKAWSIRTTHFRDPDNNLIEINQAL